MLVFVTSLLALYSKGCFCEVVEKLAGEHSVDSVQVKGGRERERERERGREGLECDFQGSVLLVMVLAGVFCLGAGGFRGTFGGTWQTLAPQRGSADRQPRANGVGLPARASPEAHTPSKQASKGGPCFSKLFVNLPPRGRNSPTHY